MLEVIHQYRCNFCNQIIDPSAGPIRAVLVGRVDPHDNRLLPYAQEAVHHYHDSCFEKFTIFKQKEPDPEPEEEPPNVKRKKDLGKLRALIEGGWSTKQIADEFRVTRQTIGNWKRELEKGEEDGAQSDNPTTL